MKKRDWMLVVFIVLLLLVVAFVSGVFYFNLVFGSVGTGHVVFEDTSEDNSFEERSVIPVIEGNVITREINGSHEDSFG